VKLLLTSGGVTNASIRDALVELLGKPIAESTALCIPTAQYGHPMVGPGVRAWQFISGNSQNPMVDLGWKSVGVLELTALPSIDKEGWVPLQLGLKLPAIPGIGPDNEFHEVHELLVWVTLALVVLHVGAALYNQFLSSTNVADRMWPFKARH